MAFVPKLPNNEFKQFVYEQFSRIGKALSSPQRLIILNILCQGEHSVDSIARYASLSVANVSRHLQIMKSANLVRMRREGKFIYYTVPDDDTCCFYSAFKEFATNQLSEIREALEQISHSPTRLHPMKQEDLLQKMEEEDVIIIDVRPQEEYQSGHIPGSISVPLDTLEKQMKKLPKNKQIIALCRGVFCILADQAVEFLISKGYSACRAEDGLVEWKLAGLPVELTT